MIYLYIKKHNKTGLKYLGKTTRNPFTYHGSGLYWKKHIQKYGYDIETKIIYQTNDDALFHKFAIAFSRENDIVNSSEWANLKEESGNGGFSSDSQRKGFENGIGVNPSDFGRMNGGWNKGMQSWNSGKELSKSHKKALSESGKKRFKSEDERRKISKTLKEYHQQNVSPNKGLIREKIICPHCNKEGAKNTMYRWHFDNCKTLL